MKEIFIFIFMITIIFVFIYMNKGEVSYVESFKDKNLYLVRNITNKKEAADTLATIKSNLNELVSYLTNQLKQNNKEIKKYELYINRMADKITKSEYSESSPNSKYTSYSINKGEALVFCVRSKKTNKIHNMNLLMYVALHELAHIGCPEVGHTKLFGNINKFLLKQAMNINIYNYSNYEANPVEYCGMDLNTTILN